MEGRSWISWLLFLGFAGAIAWAFSKGSFAIALLIFAVLTIPILLWARAKGMKIHPSEGMKK